MSVKMIKGYLTNFSKDQNFTRSAGYDAAMEAQAAKKAYEASIIARMNKMNAAEGKLSPEEAKLYETTQAQRDSIDPNDPRLGTGGVGQPVESGISPLGVGLGALAGAAALGFGAWKLNNAKTELKADGYYAFDNSITKGACRNLNNPGKSRAEVRKNYPTSRIIKGSTAYQLNPQEFKVSGNFSQENFAEGGVQNATIDGHVPLKRSLKSKLSPIPWYNRPDAVDNIKSARAADSIAYRNDILKEAEKEKASDNKMSSDAGVKVTVNEKNFNPDSKIRTASDSTHQAMNRRWFTPSNPLFPHHETVNEYNRLLEKRANGGVLSDDERAFLYRCNKAVASGNN